jgi:hypothetical protein
MYINKTQGALLVSLPMMSLYFYVLHKLIIGSSWYEESLYLLCAGIFFLYFRDFRNGRELIFLGNYTGRYWTGWGLDPTCIPILQNFGMGVPWGFRRAFDEEDYFDREAQNVHHLDDRVMKFRMNVPGTPTQAVVGIAFGAVFRWLNPFIGDPFYLHKRLGVLLILIAVSLGWTTGPQPSQFFKKKMNSFSTILMQKNTVNVSLQLKEPGTTSPLFPAKHLFEVTQGKEWVYEMVNGKKYYHFNLTGEDIPTFTFVEPMCMAIPAGFTIRFKTNRPPIYAGNMDGKVEYYRSPDSIFFVVKFITMVARQERPHSKSYLRNRHWEEMRKNWEDINEQEGFLAQALPKNKISGDVLGGMVCF